MQIKTDSDNKLVDKRTLPDLLSRLTGKASPTSSICLNETKDQGINFSFPQQYTVYNSPRKLRGFSASRGGGAAILVHESLHFYSLSCSDAKGDVDDNILIDATLCFSHALTICPTRLGNSGPEGSKC